MDMVTISADVSSQMLKWADSMVKRGLYKSRSEVVRELFRQQMCKDEAYFASLKSFADAWKDEDDAYWESFLTKEEKARLVKK